MTDKVVLITGGSGGYGKGMARVMSEAGYRVWITGRREEALRKVADEYAVQWRVADVTSANDWARVVEDIVNSEGKIDVLINNAGAGVRIDEVDKQSVESIEQSISINLTGAMLGVHAVMPVMKRQRSGHIINVSSVCAVHAWSGYSVYSAAKAGLEMFSRCAHVEGREYGVRSTVYRPSWGATDFCDAANVAGHSDDVLSQCMQGEECGVMIKHIIETPKHLAMPLVTTQPMVQSIVPM